VDNSLAPTMIPVENQSREAHNKICSSYSYTAYVSAHPGRPREGVAGQGVYVCPDIVGIRTKCVVVLRIRLPPNAIVLALDVVHTLTAGDTGPQRN